MRERLEHARHRHAREKMRSLIESRCILGEGGSAQQQQQPLKCDKSFTVRRRWWQFLVK